MTVYVGLVAGKVDMGQIIREYFCFPSSVPLHHWSIIVFNSSTIDAVSYKTLAVSLNKIFLSACFLQEDQNVGQTPI